MTEQLTYWSLGMNPAVVHTSWSAPVCQTKSSFKCPVVGWRAGMLNHSVMLVCDVRRRVCFSQVITSSAGKVTDCIIVG